MGFGLQSKLSKALKALLAWPVCLFSLTLNGVPFSLLQLHCPLCPSRSDMAPYDRDLAHLECSSCPTHLLTPACTPHPIFSFIALMTDVFIHQIPAKGQQGARHVSNVLVFNVII